jgi:hypothetical protein
LVRRPDGLGLNRIGSGGRIIFRRRLRDFISEIAEGRILSVDGGVMSMLKCVHDEDRQHRDHPDE